MRRIQLRSYCVVGVDLGKRCIVDFDYSLVFGLLKEELTVLVSL